ncbi:MAG: YbjN domain-containing protein [Thermoguttaceae bacterium]
MSVISALENYLQEDEIKYTRLETGVYDAHFRIECGTVRVIWAANDDTQDLLTLAIPPLTVPEPRRVVVADFLNRVNYQSKRGNFEMDVSDGEVRYRCFIDAEGIALTTLLIRRATQVALLSCNHYFSSIIDICHKDKSVDEAFNEVSAERDEPNEDIPISVPLATDADVE